MKPAHRAAGAGPASVLSEIIRVVCSTLPQDDVVAALGSPAGEGASPRFTRIEPTRFGDVRRIDHRPWSADDFGVVELELVEPGAWRVADLEPLLGPLRTMPVLHEAGVRVQGVLEDPSVPAWAVVYLDLDGPADDPATRIAAITIRMEPPAA